MNLEQTKLAKEVLIKAQDQIIREIAVCGNNGGVGRAQNYAPILVNLDAALTILDKLIEPGVVKKAADAERMAKVRAAKDTSDKE